MQTAKTEANDNYRYLVTLEDLFRGLTEESADFTLIPNLFYPIMHTILLIWKNSTYYNTPSKLVVLIREICNAIISQAFKLSMESKYLHTLRVKSQKKPTINLFRLLRCALNSKKPILYIKLKLTMNGK